MALTREQEQQSAQDRVKKDYESRNKFGFSGKSAINLDVIGGYREGLLYKAKEGFNKIDIVPYIVKTDRHPQKVKAGIPDYVLDLWVHRYVGPAGSTFVCLKEMYGKACPICEELEIVRKDKNASKEDISALRAKRRCWYNVINLDLPEDQQTIMIMEESHYLFGKDMLSAAVTRSKEFIPFFERETGKSIEFIAEKNNSPQGSYFKYKQFAFIDREPYLSSIYEETYAFDEMLVIPTYEEVRAGHLGLDDNGEPEAAPEPDPEEKASNSAGRRRSAVPEEKTEEKEPEVSERKSRSRRQAPIEEAEDKPKSRVARGRKQAPVEEPKEEVNPCPSGHVFGKDNDSDEFTASSCSKCPEETLNACALEYDKVHAKK